jgi:hypothetical protein
MAVWSVIVIVMLMQGMMTRRRRRRELGFRDQQQIILLMMMVILRRRRLFGSRPRGRSLSSVVQWIQFHSIQFTRSHSSRMTVFFIGIFGRERTTSRRGELMIVVAGVVSVVGIIRIRRGKILNGLGREEIIFLMVLLLLLMSWWWLWFVGKEFFFRRMVMMTGLRTLVFPVFRWTDGQVRESRFTLERMFFIESMSGRNGLIWG